MLKPKLLFSTFIIFALLFGLPTATLAYTRSLVNSSNFACYFASSSQQGAVLINKKVCNTKPCMISSHSSANLVYLTGAGNQLSGTITLQCIRLRSPILECTIHYGRSSSFPVVTNLVHCNFPKAKFIQTLNGNISISNP